MSITKSYNRHTDTYYAYDTTYEWDKKLNKRIQRRKCIGKYDPVTGNVIPNGRRGRPTKRIDANNHPRAVSETVVDAGVGLLGDAAEGAEAIRSQMDSILARLSGIGDEMAELRDSIDVLARQLRTGG